MLEALYGLFILTLFVWLTLHLNLEERLWFLDLKNSGSCVIWTWHRLCIKLTIGPGSSRLFYHFIHLICCRCCSETVQFFIVIFFFLLLYMIKVLCWRNKYFKITFLPCFYFFGTIPLYKLFSLIALYLIIFDISIAFFKQYILFLNLHKST